MTTVVRRAAAEESVAYAGVWSRAVAMVIDWALGGAIQALLFFAVMGSGLFESASSAFRPLYVLVSQGIPAAIVMFFWTKWSATPGKMILGLRIVDAYTGAHPSFRQFLERYFAYYLSALPFGLGFFWAAWDRRKQTWHDKLASTLVVRRASSGGEVVQFNTA